MQTTFLVFRLIEHHPAGEAPAFAFKMQNLVRHIELHLLRAHPAGAQHFGFR